ncbi:MAG TPA: hypothetical protein PK419_09065 [Spirochaetota bacterium]|nr:hypothetical protein [Spirochaetota bacterium]HQE59382.1 hypothetical protein [Spirochaetota bacterium]
MSDELSKVTDLDELLPEDGEIRFKDKDGAVHSFKVFVPFAVGMYICEHSEEIAELFRNRKISKETAMLVLKIATMIFNEQNKQINEEWMKRNVSLPRLMVIIIKMITPVMDYMKNMNLLSEITGMVTPQKKP